MIIRRPDTTGFKTLACELPETRYSAFSDIQPPYFPPHLCSELDKKGDEVNNRSVMAPHAHVFSATLPGNKRFLLVQKHIRYVPKSNCMFYFLSFFIFHHISSSRNYLPLFFILYLTSLLIAVYQSIHNDNEA